MTRRIAFLIAAVFAAASAAFPARAQQLKLAEIDSLSAAGVTALRPNTISFSDHRRDESADPNTGLIGFQDWARSQPLQKKYLSLYPAYAEPTVSATIDGVSKPTTVRLSMYVAEARFELPRAAASLDLARYISLPFLEKIDPAIKQTAITPDDVIPAKDSNFAFNRNPARAWCGPERKSLCIQSRYQLEGKLPAAVHLANRLIEGKKHDDYLAFQSELSIVPQSEINQDDLKQLTGVDAPVAGVLEQNIFYVNQVMEFGKFLAVFQPHPTDANKTVATVYLALAIKTRVLDRRKSFESVPVLRNLVPAQVLMGNSSFNTGNSLSAGLPRYSRHQIAAIANILASD